MAKIIPEMSLDEMVVAAGLDSNAAKRVEELLGLREANPKAKQKVNDLLNESIGTLQVLAQTQESFGG